MSEAPLYHRIYTHVPAEPGQPGGGVYRLEEVDAEGVLGEAALRRLDALVASIVPPPDGEAWAMCRFAGKEHEYACLVVSRSAGDAIERNGVLTHARLVEVEAGRAMLDLPALLEVAQSAPNAASLAALAKRLREEEPAVAVAPWAAESVEPYDREDVSAILAGLLAGVRQPEPTVRALLPEGGERLNMLVNVWPLLPLVFQRRISCSVDAGKGARVSVSFGTEQPKAPSELRKLARRYVDWMFDRPDDARRLIETMPGPGLLEFEQKLKALSGGPTMTKPKRGDPKPQPQPQPQGGGIDPKLVEFLNEQVEASEASIYQWLERALEKHNIDADAPPSRFHRGAAPAGKPPVAMIAIGVIALLALLGAAGMWWRASRAEQRISELEDKVLALSQGTGVPLPQTPATETAAEDPPPDPLRAPETIAGKDWPERFQWVVENRQRELVPGIVGIAQVARSSTLSNPKKQQLQAMVDVLNRNGALNSADRRMLRAMLFELIAAERITDNRKVAVDGAPADVPASAVTRVKDELRIVTASNDPADAELQSEVVLRWIAQEP